MWRSIFILFTGMLLLVLLGFMHQLDEPKSLSHWEEVGNPPPTHMQPRTRRKRGNKGAEDLTDASTRIRTRDL
jgi:hypothetical protein